jgi:hypothetical protein
VGRSTAITVAEGGPPRQPVSTTLEGGITEVRARAACAERSEATEKLAGPVAKRRRRPSRSVRIEGSVTFPKAVSIRRHGRAAATARKGDHL